MNLTANRVTMREKARPRKDTMLRKVVKLIIRKIKYIRNQRGGLLVSEVAGVEKYSMGKAEMILILDQKIEVSLEAEEAIEVEGSVCGSVAAISRVVLVGSSHCWREERATGART